MNIHLLISFLLTFQAIELKAPSSILRLPSESLLPQLMCKGLLHVSREVCHLLCPDVPEALRLEAPLLPIKGHHSLHQLCMSMGQYHVVKDQGKGLDFHHKCIEGLPTSYGGDQHALHGQGLRGGNTYSPEGWTAVCKDGIMWPVEVIVCCMESPAIIELHLLLVIVVRRGLVELLQQWLSF